jgi:hypothetical protein
MLEMVSPICLLPPRLTFSLPKRGMVSQNSPGPSIFEYATDHNSDLVTYCEREGMPFTTFESWETILDTTKDILSGKVSLKKVAEEGLKKVHEQGN